MSNKKKNKDGLELESEEEDVSSSPVAPTAPVVVVRKAAHVAPKTEPLMTFTRWFATTGRPARHKAGLEAFTNTKGKRTPAAWNAAFKNY